MISRLLSEGQDVPHPSTTYRNWFINTSRYFASLYMFYEMLPLLFPVISEAFSWGFNLIIIAVAYIFHRLADVLAKRRIPSYEGPVVRTAWGFFIAIQLNIAIIVALYVGAFVAAIVFPAGVFLPKPPQSGPGPTGTLGAIVFSILIPIILGIGAQINSAAGFYLFTPAEEIKGDSEFLTVEGIRRFQNFAAVIWVLSWIPLVVVIVLQVLRFFETGLF